MAATKSKIVLFNPEQSPTVYDKEGRTVAGADRVTVDELDEVGKAAVDAGLLVREEESKKDAKATKDAPPLPETGEKSEDAGGSGASSPAKRG
ncbi:hypothetical protein [Actinophytocola sp.]|uniref:hypothetical protein n=1 Tax=Actinophytocola sp. TaxID=1872138 RepID=UPI002D805B60|nr:hypothetical protein [Actinophytocola sp.]HET9144156.1 hypothetical protein [Actinophytocola sp.]